MILLNRPWTYKPDHLPQLDWSNYLLKRIQPIGVYAFIQGIPVNLVTGIPAVAYGTPSAVIDPQGGRASYSPAATVGSTTASYWDTKIKADASFRFLARWGRPSTAPAYDEYDNGSHDGANRFYVNPRGYSTTTSFFGWGGGVYEPSRSVAPAAGVREMQAMSVSNVNSTQGAISGYLNGMLLGTSATNTFSATSTRNIYIGKRTDNNATEDGSVQAGYANNIDLYIFGRGSLTPAEVAGLYANPYQIFKPIPRHLWVPVISGGAAALTSTTSAVGSATSALVTQITLGGGATVEAVTSTILSTGTSVAASAESVATLGTISLTTQIACAAAASSEAVSGAALVTEIQASAAALAEATAVSDLTVAAEAAALVSNVTASAAVTGAATTQINMLCVCENVAAVPSAILTTQVVISGNISSVATLGTIGLTTQIAAAANAAAEALSGAELGTEIKVYASSYAVGASVASIATQITLYSSSSSIAAAEAELYIAGGSAALTTNSSAAVSVTAALGTSIFLASPSSSGSSSVAVLSTQVILLCDASGLATSSANLSAPGAGAQLGSAAAAASSAASQLTTQIQLSGSCFSSPSTVASFCILSLSSVHTLLARTFEVEITVMDVVKSKVVYVQQDDKRVFTPMRLKW